jgi:acyl carrier protein
MGLEAVEILMEVEEAFDITIEDAEAEKMRTPRDLIESVLGRVNRVDSAACLTQRAFNLLRRALLGHLPLKRRDIAPSVPMANLVAKNGRQDLIGQLASELKTGPLPDLVRPRWMVHLLTGVCLATGVGVMVVFHLLKPSVTAGRSLFAGGLTASLLGFFAWLATNFFRTEFPPAVATVGDLARWIMAHKTDLADATPGRWTREQIAARVREIVIGHLNRASTYREDASFIKDLGLG